eukprot:EC123267.1.p2 GENE.EC123267.1~~EC123267.1.p2  ORF type:complete len:114 (+),score=25.36 EC123267.1:223-564(+)
MDGARIYAQNAIRKKNEASNYLRLASRIDAVSSRLQTAMKMNAVNKNMQGVVKTMQKTLDTMDLEKISKTMDTFEKRFEDLDVPVRICGELDQQLDHVGNSGRRCHQPHQPGR